MEKWLFMDAAALSRSVGGWDTGSGPLYEQLAAALRAAVERGELAPGTRLPSERRLAGELGVSRGTVVAAYGVLRDADLVRSRQGSGSVVAGAPPPARDTGEFHLDTLLGLNVTANVDTRRDFVNLLPACWRDTSGLPADVFTLDDGDARGAGGSHGYHSTGLPELREAVADSFSERGLATSPEQILITAGAHQAIGLLTQMCAGPGDTVLCEELTYPGARDLFRAAGTRVVGAPLGPGGVNIGDLDRRVREVRPRLVYLIPTVHNPTSAVLPEEERAHLADVAAQWDAVLVDDESLAETRLDGPPPPPIVSFAPGPEAVSRLFTVGSASKSFWGGLRVGWIRGPEPAIVRLTRLKTLADLASPVLSQLVAARLLRRSGDVLPGRRAALRERFDTVTRALAEHLPGWTWPEPRGGLALWARLPGGDATRFAEVAARHGVGVVPGPVCAVEGGFRDHVRLGVGVDPGELEEGARRLAEAWHAVTGGRAPSETVEVIV